jgi:hypothetical protein
VESCGSAVYMDTDVYTIGKGDGDAAHIHHALPLIQTHTFCTQCTQIISCVLYCQALLMLIDERRRAQLYTTLIFG